MATEVTLASSAQDINIIAVIDTEWVKRTYPNPSQDQTKPTGIAHNGQFLICTGARGIKGQGTADLEFIAYPGDRVQFTGVSIYDNSDDAVIIYNIPRYSGDEVFNPFVCNTVVRNGAVEPNPDSGSRNGLPPLKKQLTFATFDSSVRKSGTEYFGVCFALYKLVGGQNQELVGYYWWDPKIVVPA
ncbi:MULTISPECIES: inclusion body family protein [Burkholderia]|uniref:DNA-directed RNA polymerase subunit beta n=1 Tax=Burkholderia aenigmatica TaxID=2015348 RepID=A0A228I8I9_9BURK|nr:MULTISPECIES: inclusion body family protein [Burkholderia]KER70569.1 DNA-directed RNA polymerase subunit beta [Burkholderia cepacia]MBN3842344.1 DNA-directed RNA polymerase subunit beta [Burkholderia sp. Ac-20349]MDN7874044.1 inclusion body family protein [Burkholderia aenigmatica]OXI38475.1 DNA-directed RNA polymerase subunit beta [Burkholderia aenigmatica]